MKLRADMLLAMTQSRLGQSDAARTTLSNGTTFADTKTFDDKAGASNDRCSAYLLMREAKIVCKGVSPE